MTDDKIVNAFCESLGSFRYSAVDGPAPINKKNVKKLKKEDKEFVIKLWNGLKVYRVDFTVVRDTIDVAAVGGLHPLESHYVPKDEIWIEKQKNPLDEIFYLAHEVFEYEGMKSLGTKYNKQHDRSNDIEHSLRQIYQAALKDKKK
jgi:hypothetical protein